MSLLKIYQWVSQWKNFENRLTFGEVIGKSLVSCFFLRHSVDSLSLLFLCNGKFYLCWLKSGLRSATCKHTKTLWHTHTRLTALFPGLPKWAGTTKVKPIWTLLMQETASGSGISWAICKSAPISSQITMPAPHHKDIIILIQISGTVVRVTSFMLFTQTLVEFHTVKTCPGVMH